MRFLASFFLLLLILTSCDSQKSVSESSTVVKSTPYDPNTIEVTQADIPLSDYLSRIIGVSVRGSGANATITIRGGGNSIMAGTEPLFLIDGSEFTGGFSAISQVVSVSDIKSVTVYKNASETARYGVRGANGVINIKLKK